MRSPVLLVGMGLLAVACGDDDVPVPADGGADAAPPTCEETFQLETGDPDGHPEPLGAGAGEARAGRLLPAAMPSGASRLLTWKAGDFVLANDRIAVVIDGVGPSQGYNPFGGEVVGLARVRDGALFEPADFNEVITGAGIHAVQPESVTVLADGSDGGPAIVRSKGLLTPIPFLEVFLAGAVSGSYENIEAALDYVLEPDAEHVVLRYHFASTRPRDERVRQPLHLFFQKYRMPAWSPDIGFDEREAVEVPFFAFADDEATSYAWRQIDSDLTFLLDVSGASVFIGGEVTIPACALTTRDHVRIDVGGTGLDGLLEAVARTDGDVLRPLSGSVRQWDATPAAGVRVHAVRTDGRHLTRTLTDDLGVFTLHVPEGEDVDLSYFRRGDEVAGPLRVAAGADATEVTLAETGFIEVAATEVGPDTPLPVRVQVVPEGDLPSVPRAFGEPEIARGRLHVEYPTDGRVTLRAPVGDHRVLVSRGYEYELFSEVVTVAAGVTTPVTAPLERVVDTAGALCADFHIHTNRSLDSEDSAGQKIRAAAADGLEIPVRSDHEWVRDFEPDIADLALGAWLYGVSSIELTTFSYGHFGVFPLDRDASMPNDGAFEWAGRLPPDVFADVRARTGTWGPAALVINHPRGGGFGAYFDAAGYDPVTGMVARPDYWDESFQLVEVFNDDTFDDKWDPSGADSTVADWFSFLSSGRRVFAVGSSDSHTISDSPVGYPRTCIALGTDDPEVLRTMGAGVIRDDLLEGRATISGGIYVDAVARGGVGPGGDVTGAAARETVRVTVQAASWIEAEQLRVFADGVLVETIALDETTVDPLRPTVRFDADLEVPVGDGPVPTWAVFVASGGSSLAPVHPRRMPFGVTNPIFFAR